MVVSQNTRAVIDFACAVRKVVYKYYSFGYPYTYFTLTVYLLLDANIGFVVVNKVYRRRTQLYYSEFAQLNIRHVLIIISGHILIYA